MNIVHRIALQADRIKDSAIVCSFSNYITAFYTLSETLNISMKCSRKNFIFLFGALINLTVRVDTYFQPIRMTYPIQSGSFFRAAPNWGKAAKQSLPKKLSNWTDILTVHSRHHEESHLIDRPLESILLDQGFPVDYELDEFNPPHTRTTLSCLQLWLC